MYRVRENISRSEKSQGHRGHRKVKCEISALVMINLCVKFIVHSSYTRQVMVLEVADRRTDAPGDDIRHPLKFCRCAKHSRLVNFREQHVIYLASIVVF